TADAVLGPRSHLTPTFDSFSLSDLTVKLANLGLLSTVGKCVFGDRVAEARGQGASMRRVSQARVVWARILIVFQIFSFNSPLRVLSAAQPPGALPNVRSLRPDMPPFAKARPQVRSSVSTVVPPALTGRVSAARSADAVGLEPLTMDPPPSNPIVVENQQTGTSNWRISNYGNDSAGQIKGYASAVSVNKGENITFHVSVNPAQTYNIEVFRIGWYQGLGARLMAQAGPLGGTQQPICPMNATTGMIECAWTPSYVLATQTSWTSGIYLARLTNAAGYQNYIVFAVRDDSRTAALLYQQPVTTYQAYNDYPYD